MERSGRRAPWEVVPAGVLAALGEALGSPVVATGPLAGGGFSPGPAGPVTLDDGRRVFAKACGAALNPHSPDIFRREARAMEALPSGVPAPRLLAVADDGDWVALALEFVDGRTPAAPLSTADVHGVLDLVGELARCDGAPALGPALTAEREVFWAWRRASADGAIVDRLDPWSRRHLDALVALEADWVEATAGDALVHGDLRTDNVVLRPDGTGVVVDWPGAGRGAPWVDLVGLLPSFHLDGAPPPVELFAAHPVGRAAPAAAVDSFLAALAGYFTRQSLLPPPPGLPTVRSFQAAQGRVARAWLAERTGWA